MHAATPDSPKMFENEFVDFFSRTSPVAVPIVFVPVALYALSVSWGLQVAPLWIAVQFVAGFVSWTLTEYWLHRTFFHWEPDTWWGPKLHFFVHGVHHQWVNDPYRLVMPPAVSIPLAALFWAIFQGIQATLGGVLDPTWAAGVFAGFVVGYTTYDLMHYFLHHARPRWKWMVRLKAHHMNHHHQHKPRKYGVSSTVWDHVFGTM